MKHTQHKDDPSVLRRPRRTDLDRLQHLLPELSRDEALAFLYRQWRREALVHVRGQLLGNVDVRECLLMLINVLLQSDRRRL